MENNLENKLKFLGAHIGCDIEWLREDDNKWIQSKLTVYDFGFYAIKKVRLLVKPLSKISNEDAFYVSKIQGFPIFDKEEMFGKAYDYLRSKSYALPYMGLSVEEQVERGWVRLIE